MALHADGKLRVWSALLHQTIFSQTVCSFPISEQAKPTGRVRMKLFIDEATHTEYVVVAGTAKTRQPLLVSTGDDAENTTLFSLYRIQSTAGGMFDLKLEEEILRSAPVANLVDFELCGSFLWASWYTAESYTIQCAALVSHHMLYSEDSNNGGQPSSTEYNEVPCSGSWEEVFVWGDEEGEASRDDVIAEDTADVIDIRNHFLSRILLRHRFPRPLLLSVLQTTEIPEEPGALDLEQEMITYVEQQVAMRLAGAGDSVTDEDLPRIARLSWAQLLADCRAAAKALHEPLSLCVRPRQPLLGLLCTGGVSVIRRLSNMEQVWHTIMDSMMRSNQTGNSAHPLGTYLENDEDLLALCAQTVAQSITPDVIAAFMIEFMKSPQGGEDLEGQLFRSVAIGGRPSNAASALHFLNVGSIFARVENPVNGLRKLVEQLRPKDLNMAREPGEPVEGILEWTVARSCVQAIREGVAVAVRVLILILYVLHMRSKAKIELSPSEIFDIQSVLLPKARARLRAYGILQWLSDAELMNPTLNRGPGGAEDEEVFRAQQRFARISVGSGVMADESGGVITMFVQHMRSTIQQAMAGASFRDSIADALPRAIHAVLLNLWCAEEDPLGLQHAHHLVGFLFKQGQYAHALALIEMVGRRSAVLQYLEGHCFFELGEYKRAFESFMAVTTLDAVREITSPSNSKVGPSTGVDAEDDEDMEGNSRILRFLQALMERFEVALQLGIVVDLANVALMYVPDELAREKSLLWCTVFKYCLELGRYDEAYQALAANNDAERRKDCVRRYVVELWEKGESWRLNDLPHGPVIDDVKEVLKFKADRSDIHQSGTVFPTFYHLLYALLVTHGNFREAANTMMQYSYRISTESNPDEKESLHRQADALAAAITALQLLPPEAQVFVNNRSKKRDPSSAPDHPMASPKRPRDSYEHVEDSGEGGRDTTSYVQLKDVERQYALLTARIELLAHVKHIQGIGRLLSPKEMMVLLVHAGLYDTAELVTRQGKVPWRELFIALADKCVITVTAHFRGDAAADTEVWNALKELLFKKDGVHNDWEYHTICAERLLAGLTSMRLPTWMIGAFKGDSSGFARTGSNPCALLNVFLKYGLLDDATLLVVDILQRMDEQRENDRSAQWVCTTWLPYTLLEQLSEQLQLRIQSAEGASLSSPLRERLESLKYHIQRHLQWVQTFSPG
eukprot:CAMPEP_0184658626 /NCGR_PEP_ID=MMETSP0308-20130426/26226_1 /TAXON_ID=38269 /ORGANISM="Gloeochaete witrockiana, Strain SAG 46.84" /LENGTH=1192 /DNA_ID=CAMNT_0027097757 /DNA_START=825 /DNA_END=4403 /DNA_ORIENTATION=-